MRGALSGVLAALAISIGVLVSVVPPLLAQDELLINDDRVARSQFAPKAARGSTNSLVLCWTDGRNGPDTPVDYDIYAMTIRDPLALGATLNRRLNDDDAGAIQANPDIAASPAGTIFAVWEDSRARNPDIFGVVLDTLGLRTIPNLRINDDAGTADQRNPRVCAVGADRYLVVWGDQRSGQSDIYASYRTSGGAPIGMNLVVSADTVSGGSYQGEPAVASNANGLTLVVWLDGREGGTVFGTTFDVYGQWIDSQGTLIGGNFKVNDAVNDSTGLPRDASPVVAADPTQGFVAAWIDRRLPVSQDPGDVYAQRYGPDGSTVGGNVRVNDDSPKRDQRSVRAIPGPDGAYLFWEDLRESFGLDANVESARVPYDASPPGPNYRVNGSAAGRQGTPSAVWDGRDAFIAVWEDSRNGAADIYANTFLPGGVRRSSDTQMNDDAARNDQWHPHLGHGPGQYVLTWIDRRNGSNDLYGQWVMANGGRDGTNFVLQQEGSDARPVSSDAAATPGGPALVVAQVTRFSDAGEIRGFLLPSSGSPPGGGFWISDTLSSAQASPVVSARLGEFAVAWIDSRDAGPRLYGQRLAGDGTRVGSNHPLLTQEPSEPPSAVDLVEDPAGGYWLLYAEGTGTDQRLWLAHMDATLVEDAAPVEVAPGFGGPKEAPALAVASDGRIEVVWQGVGASGLSAVYQLAFGAGLVPLGPVFAPGDPSYAGARAFPSIAVLGSRSIVTWQEKRDGNWSIWMQVLDQGIVPASGIVRVDEDTGQADQYQPSVGLDAQGHAFFTWADTRSLSSGSDVLARVMELAPTAVDPLPDPAPSPPPAPPSALRVLPARPNPFSGSLGVPVEVPPDLAGRVRARVLNAQGAVAATLYDGPAPEGRLMVRWDGADARGRPVASGVYWLLIEAGGERHAIRLVRVR